MVESGYGRPSGACGLGVRLGRGALHLEPAIAVEDGRHRPRGLLGAHDKVRHPGAVVARGAPLRHFMGRGIEHRRQRAQRLGLLPHRGDAGAYMRQAEHGRLQIGPGAQPHVVSLVSVHRADAHALDLGRAPARITLPPAVGRWGEGDRARSHVVEQLHDELVTRARHPRHRDALRGREEHRHSLGRWTAGRRCVRVRHEQCRRSREQRPRQVGAPARPQLDEELAAELRRRAVVRHCQPAPRADGAISVALAQPLLAVVEGVGAVVHLVLNVPCGVAARSCGRWVSGKQGQHAGVAGGNGRSKAHVAGSNHSAARWRET